MTQAPLTGSAYGCRVLPWLAPLRVARGWTQVDLALEARVSLDAIRRLEAGGAARLQTVHRLAAALEVSSQTLHAPTGVLTDAGTGLTAGAYAHRLPR